MITDQTAADMEALRSRLHTEPHLQQLTVFIINLRLWEMWDVKDRTWNANVGLLAPSSPSPGSRNKHNRAGEGGELYLLALVDSLAAVLLEILASFFLGWVWSRCSGPGCSGRGASLCSASELPPLVLGLSSGLGCTSLDMLTLHTEEQAEATVPSPCRDL